MTAGTEPSFLLLKQRHSGLLFGATLVISLLLHLAASSLLFLPGRYSVPVSAPLFVELQSMAAPVETPQQEAQLPDEPTPAPAEPLVPEAPKTSQLEQAVDNSLRRAEQTPEAVHESSIGLGIISGHFASFAQGESLKHEIRAYYFELMRRINEVWWTSGAAKGSFVGGASVNLVISRDGSVIGVELLESSGSREQDQALLESIKKAEPLPPLPESFPQLTFSAPIRFVPPLRLMLPGLGNRGLTAH